MCVVSADTVSVQFEGDTEMQLNLDGNTTVMTLSTDNAQWDAELVMANNLTRLNITGTNAEIEAEVRFKLFDEFNGFAEVLDVNNGDELYYFQYSAGFSESDSTSQHITTLFRADNAEEDSHFDFHNVNEELLEISAQLGTSVAFVTNIYGSLLYYPSFFSDFSDSYNPYTSSSGVESSQIDLSVMLFDEWMTLDASFGHNYSMNVEWVNFTFDTTLVNLTSQTSFYIGRDRVTQEINETFSASLFSYMAEEVETTAYLSARIFDLHDDFADL